MFHTCLTNHVYGSTLSKHCGYLDTERRREGNAGLGKRGASFGIHGLQFFSTLFGFAALLCKTIAGFGWLGSLCSFARWQLDC